MTDIELDALTLRLLDDEKLQVWLSNSPNETTGVLKVKGAIESQLAGKQIYWRLMELLDISTVDRFLLDLSELDGQTTHLPMDDLRNLPYEVELRNDSVFKSGDIKKDIAQKVNFEISKLSVESFSWKRQEMAGALLRFSGEYLLGSAGKHDGIFVSWHIDEVCDYLKPKILVNDFRRMSYDWGDDLFPVPPPITCKCTRVLIRDDQIAAFKGIVPEKSLVLSEADAFR